MDKFIDIFQSLSDMSFDDFEGCIVDSAISCNRVNELLAAASELLGRMDKEEADRLLSLIRKTSCEYRELSKTVRIVC